MDGLTDQCRRAIECLKRGALVGLPTETVYGLAADASNALAVGRLYEAKGRPAHKPLPLLVPDLESVASWVREVPDTASQLAAAFWPGPLTLILKRSERVLDLISGGGDTVGIRVPAHGTTLAILTALGRPLAVPSANRSGEVSATSAEQVRAALGGRVEMVVDGGPCALGLESTVVDLSSETLTILRRGMVSADEINAVLGGETVQVMPSAAERPFNTNSVVRLCDATTLNAQVDEVLRSGRLPGVLGHSLGSSWPGGVPSMVLPASSSAFARGFYAALSSMDQSGVDVILVEQPPPGPEGDAIIRRLPVNAPLS